MEDPYRWYESLRERTPVLCVDDDLWLISRYEDVAAAGRDAERFSSWFGNDRGRRHVDALPSIDPPEHTRIRRAVAAPFLPRATTGYEDVVERVVERACARLGGTRRRIDAIRSFAGVVPVEVLAAVLDMEARSLAAAADSAGPYKWSLFARALQTGSGEVLSGLRAAVAAGGVAEREAVSFLVLLLTAAVETTRDLFGELLLLAARRPEVWEDLAAAPPDAAPAITEELLRWVSPLQAVYRTTTVAVEVAAAEIPAGASVMLLIGSANRDERHWLGADRLDLGRFADGRANDHLAFGFGPHHCLGAALARLQIAAVVRALPRDVAGFEIDGDVARRTSPMVRGVLTLPVRVRTES